MNIDLCKGLVSVYVVVFRKFIFFFYLGNLSECRFFISIVCEKFFFLLIKLERV